MLVAHYLLRIGRVAMPSVNLFMLVGCALFITGVLFNLIGFASNHFA